MLAERRKQRRAVTPARVEVRYVKFTPEEMAIDAANVDASKPSKRRVELDADVAKVFKDAASVNTARRKLIEAMPESAPAAAKRPPRRKAS